MSVLFRSRDTDKIGNELTYHKLKEYIKSMRHIMRLPKEIIKLKRGVKVMLLRNVRVGHGWVNGTIAFVDHLGPNFVSLHKAKNPESRHVAEPFLHQITCMNEDAYRRQIPLEPAYAATVHKVQGQTLDKTVIHAEGMFGSGMAYTACSRPKCLEDLYFTALDRQSFKTDPMYVRFLEYLDQVDVLNDENSCKPLPEYPDMPYPKRSEFHKANPLSKKDKDELESCNWEGLVDREP